MRVFVRQREPEEPWRPATGEESICVWDIEVIKRERDLFVRTAVTDGRTELESYLAAD